ncbi:E3 ubiquitin-protein ligase NHLRC1-like [Acipenser ruthenus]|uniref:E3 ubiquitin-protein ligase NHLRC1-like n=1 Tax=Acipenser ruthenus TaxID=7906 RepID=UPI00145ACA76|nr:E3 ubiquitin-protein ligase NHLRC1-like [Acipenser ruthenus]
MSGGALRFGSRSSSSSWTPQRILNEIETNLLECKVCFEKYSQLQKKRRPRNLPCGHVMCWECISCLAHHHYQRLECPFCRKICSSSETSDCLPLMHISELLSPAWELANGTSNEALGLTSAGVKFHFAFGGWGHLINPTGAAFFRKSGALVVVHDGKKRVSIFNLKGKYLHGFGTKGDSLTGVCYPLNVAVTLDGYIVITDAGDCSVKVFNSRGRNSVAIRESFRLPWGVDTDCENQILVTDSEAGTLSQLEVDFSKDILVSNTVATSDLCCPREIAVSKSTGSVVVVEHLRDQKARSFTGTRLKMFDSKLQLMCQIDSFGFSLICPIQLCVSGVAFDREGNVLVADGNHKVVLCLGKLMESPSLRPIISQGLVCPVGLACTADNTLIVLDSGDHAVKIYTVC